MEEQNQKSWIGRNWPWALPLGCCSGCLITIIIAVAIGGTALFGFIEEFAEMTPMEDIVVLAKENEKAVEYLGLDIETDGFPNGNISLQNGDGEADFSIGISGEKAEGTLFAKGIRSNEEWVFEELYIITKETGERIELLQE